MWIRIIKSGLAQSVERLFYKTPGRRFRPQWFFSAFLSSSFFFYYCHSKLLQSEYKVFIIRNNKLVYLSRMKSCLWGWSCYHYSLAQRPISHKIHIISCYFDNHMQVWILRNMVCEWAWVSIPGERDLLKSLNWCYNNNNIFISRG